MTQDRELLVAWRAGDAASGEQLFERRVGEITRFFRNKVGDDNDVSDLVGETFLGLTTSRDSFREDVSFRRFAYSVAQNVLRAHLRTRYKREREQVDFATVCVADLAPATPSSLLMKQSSARAFVDSLRELPLGDQAIVELKYFEGLTGPEIADAFGLPEGTVRGRIARAVDRLRIAVGRKINTPRDPATAAAQPSADELEGWARAVRIQLGRDEAPG